ncbi:MAG: methylenetetrahydrofolate reductase [NAD(P)H] [Phycisphaerae bacterium]|nr:methylenetetrahydrofolate reductase [NAD(P)H] [Phycisphaerae bacterium]
MRIIEEIWDRSPTLSFEFFPPKSDIGFWDLYRTIESLKPLQPSYVSVTYGAGGSTRKKTLELVTRIKRDSDIEPLVHLTCVEHTRGEIAEIVDDLKSNRIENILCLRGDPPAGSSGFEATADGFAHADDLVSFVRRRHPGLCLGAACHPETHPEAAGPEADLDNLKHKVDSGVDFLITQLFFDNADFYRFRDRCAGSGVFVPIIAGIMPILSVGQIKRFTEMCGAAIPPNYLSKIEAVEDDPDAVRHLGVLHATEQCLDLIENGVAGLHFYTLNRSTATRAIFQEIRSSLAVKSGR